MEKRFAISRGGTPAVLKTLPSSGVDAVVTDPPCSSGGITLAARQVSPDRKYQLTGTKKDYPPFFGDGKDQRAHTAWCTLWLAECWRIARDGAPLLLFTDWRQLPSMTDALQGAGWFWLGVVAWNKRTSRPQPGRFRQQCEFILFGSKGRFLPAHTTCLPGLFDIPVVAHSKVHLTGKPVPLLRELLAVTPEGALILDPFLGGGTTAVAALETGRRCIGIDLSEEYAEIARRRCEEVAARV